MAAEPAAIRTLLGAHGVSRQVTRESITDELGLNSVQAWITSMAGDPSEFASEVRRQLRDLMKDARHEDPPVPPALRPDVNPSTLAGVTNFAQTISFYAQRGQPIGVNIHRLNLRSSATSGLRSNRTPSQQHPNNHST